MSVGRILIYGGKGALGATCVSHFKSKNWFVINVDMHPNEQADTNIVIPKNSTWIEQESHVVGEVGSAIGAEKLNAIICVAGGWTGGNAAKDVVKAADLMWQQSVWSSTISAAVAAKYLDVGGLVALTGAQAALQGTAGMIGYGMAKAAVHHLTKSLGSPGSGLPDDAVAVAILPITLDTPMNRKWMPNADFGTWTPMSFVAELFDKWIKGENKPGSGSLVQLVTKSGNTELYCDESNLNGFLNGSQNHSVL